MDNLRAGLRHHHVGRSHARQIGGFLMALRVRGETVDEITGAVEVMRAKMLRVEAPADAHRHRRHRRRWLRLRQCLDLRSASSSPAAVCRSPSTAIVRLSSRSGAADVLTALGVKIDLTPDDDRPLHPEAGVGFMFAPAHHPAMKHVGPTRVELGTRTIFNLLGPLSNPAGVTRQLVGVFSRNGCCRWQGAEESRLESVWVVHGSDGLDEITTTGPTFVAALENGNIRSFEMAPENMRACARTGPDSAGGDSAAQRGLAARVLEGKPAPSRYVALLNAGRRADRGRQGQGRRRKAWHLQSEVARQRRGAALIAGRRLERKPVRRRWPISCAKIEAYKREEIAAAKAPIRSPSSKRWPRPPAPRGFMTAISSQARKNEFG
jgi:anthranilate phosphoribosyltransferase